MGVFWKWLFFNKNCKCRGFDWCKFKFGLLNFVWNCIGILYFVVIFNVWIIKKLIKDLWLRCGNFFFEFFLIVLNWDFVNFILIGWIFKFVW